MSRALSAVESAALDRARELAAAALGHVSPNPPVGAVVLRDGKTIAEGWHKGPGELHAEAMALAEAGAAARGATVVCTLEPCSHHGRTPPCAEALIQAGVARVVIGCADPLERERAGGRARLRDAGIEVAVAEGKGADACRDQLGPFLTWAAERRPEVTLKLATSLDGRIATASGESRWITGPPARRLVHRWRAEQDAVAVGAGTALADDPDLRARDVDGPVRQPTRVVFDAAARLPLDSRLVSSAEETPVLVMAAEDADPGRVEALRRRGVQVELGPADREDSILHALGALGEREVQSVLVEGGATLAAALLGADAVDRIAWFTAPMIIGGTRAPGAVADPGAERLADAPRLDDRTVESVGDDVLIMGRLRPVPTAV